MGLGLFGTPLAVNFKCIVFAMIILLVYWLPHPKEPLHKFVACFLLATAAYISLAWYDTLFDCNDRLQPTIFSWFSKSLKPLEYQKEYDQLPLKYKKIIRTIDVAALGVVAAAFLYPLLRPS
jgi:hypothetical protein